jgi:hypothetical protein
VRQNWLLESSCLDAFPFVVEEWVVHSLSDQAWPNAVILEA